MMKLEKELLDEKFAGVHAMIMASNDMNNEQHENIMKVINDIRKETKKTNGRVTKLEEETSVIRFFINHPKITFFLLSVIAGLLIGEPVYKLFIK